MKFLCLSFLMMFNTLQPAWSHRDLAKLAAGITREVVFSYAGPIYITASSIKLHETRSTFAKVLTEIPKGAEVKVLDSRFGNWWQIRYKSKTGFVQNTYLKYSSVNNQLEDDLVYNSSSLYNSKPTYALKSVVELYEHPSSSSAILIQLSKGVKVKVIDSTNDSWWLVHYKGRTGHMRSTDLRSDTPPQGPVIPINKLSLVPKPKPTHATTAALQMRESMSSTSSILFEVPKGTAVQVINPDFSSWAQIEYSGKTGYVPSGHFTALEALQKEASERNPSSQTIAETSADTESKTITTKGGTPDEATHALTEATSLRAAADSKAQVLTRFTPGDQVMVLDDSGEWWWEVSFNGKRGWVKRRLLEAR